jgi:hypothetical protein
MLIDVSNQIEQKAGTAPPESAKLTPANKEVVEQFIARLRRQIAAEATETVAVAASGQAVPEFETTAQGSRVATSVGGVLTGRGADIIVIDDPVKPEKALPQTQWQAANACCDHSLYSRLNDKLTGKKATELCDFSVCTTWGSRARISISYTCCASAWNIPR